MFQIELFLARSMELEELKETRGSRAKDYERGVSTVVGIPILQTQESGQWSD